MPHCNQRWQFSNFFNNLGIPIIHIQFGFNQDQISTIWDKKNCLMNFPISLYVQICPVVEAILNFQFAENTKSNIFQPHFLSNCLVVLNKKIFTEFNPREIAIFGTFKEEKHSYISWTILAWCSTMNSLSSSMLLSQRKCLCPCPIISETITLLHSKNTVKPAHVETSIKQLPVLKRSPS